MHLPLFKGKLKKMVLTSFSGVVRMHKHDSSLREHSIDYDEDSMRISKNIYLDPEVNKAMKKRKAETGVSFSFQVNKAMRVYLGLDQLSKT